MHQGACSFGLWKVAVNYEGTVIHRVRFVRAAPEGPVPVQFTRFLAGKGSGFAPLTSSAVLGEGTYAQIYRAVLEILYGETRSYGEIAEVAGTHPRVVGNAMARNPTPLIIPCHRVVASDGSIGGFSPDMEIKISLLLLEKSTIRRSIS